MISWHRPITIRYNKCAKWERPGRNQSAFRVSDNELRAGFRKDFFLVIDNVRRHLPEIVDLCHAFGITRLELFGSAATASFESGRSDIDFLVFFPDDYDYGPWMSRVFELEASLNLILGQSVDLVLPKALENRWFRREADKTRQVIFDSTQVSEVA